MSGAGLETLAELANGTLGLAALALAVSVYRVAGRASRAWRWIVAGVALFALSELSVLAEIVGGGDVDALHGIVYRALQAAFVLAMLRGLALRIAAERASEAGGDGV